MLSRLCMMALKERRVDCTCWEQQIDRLSIPDHPVLMTPPHSLSLDKTDERVFLSALVLVSPPDESGCICRDVKTNTYNIAAPSCTCFEASGGCPLCSDALHVPEQLLKTEHRSSDSS